MLSARRIQDRYPGRQETVTYAVRPSLELRVGHLLDSVSKHERHRFGKVLHRRGCSRDGAHRFTVRFDNLRLNDVQKEITLQSGVAATLNGTPQIDSPILLVAVIVCRMTIWARRKELRGAVWEHESGDTSA